MVHLDPPQLLSTVVPSMADATAANQALNDGSAVLMPRSAGKRDFIRAIEDLTGASACSEPEPLAHPPGQDPDNPKGLLAERLAHLTQQQRRVVRLVRQGMSNKRIAHVLGVGESTVKAHVTTILRKLQLTSRTQVAVIAMTLDPDPSPAAI
ncbi:LuxR C-terminal-related transcriptional regulator [uncultured Methylobacterium sp.]|uniref:LuxR C-terminal-related transcriptional regulator n=1 Tax=uncultured Methylobacterium sp. TaxID=157278 RepID=UPI0025934319|nr:LuxR C-terminal-related transcriptional regulator [uncultured Methylobacterium sp.]